MIFQLQLFREAKNVLFWPKMDDFPPFFVTFVQKMFVFDMKLFKKSQFCVQISCTGTKNVQNRQKSRKKKMNTKSARHCLFSEMRKDFFQQCNASRLVMKRLLRNETTGECSRLAVTRDVQRFDFLLDNPRPDLLDRRLEIFFDNVDH